MTDTLLHFIIESNTYYPPKKGLPSMKISISKLLPGMMLEEDVTSYNGQKILGKNTILDDKSITKLAFYAIQRVQVVTGTDGTPTIKHTEPIPHRSRQTQIINSPEFKAYKITFDSTKLLYEQEINDIVNRNSKVDSQKLLSQIASISNASGSNNIFDMLHNMRNYDDSTYAHCINVSLICGVFGKWLNMSEKDIETLTLAGLLHDIGKLLIPEQIIKKPSKLTNDEFEIIKSHPSKGYELFRHSSLDSRIKNAILMHHEKCDGSGYPFGLEASAIDFFAKIVTIADIYDATTSARIYRGPLCPFTVIDLFKQDGFQKYDPRLMMVFLENVVSTYLGQDALLSNGETGTIVFINKSDFSKPIVKVGETCIDLSKEFNLTVSKIV